ncbi:hypothetical protein [Sorangium sp. So ce406]
MSRRARRSRSSQQGAELLEKHLVDKVTVSDTCGAHHLQSSRFY